MEVWDKQRLVEAIKLKAKQLGYVPKVRDFEGSKDARFPSYYLIRKHFGTYNKGIEAAGLEPRPRFGQRESSEEISRRMKAWYQTNEHPRGMLGKHHSLETRAKISEAGYGQKHSLKSRRKISASNKGKPGFPLSENPNWKGGISFEPYTSEFNKSSKQMIHSRDGFICQNCFRKIHGHASTAHHIDYDKKNNDSRNLITLCRVCNSRANFNRAYWKNVYQWVTAYSSQLMGGIL